MIFRARQFELRFPRPALVMGIVNVTPDSFSDGGKFLKADNAVAHARELVAQGAEILDVGGESTRPNAEPVAESEELRRVIPVIEKLAQLLGPTKPASRPAGRPVLVSIDTMKPAVARAALQAGASIVNDVAAHRTDDAMWKIVAEFRAGYICMHAPGSGTGILPVELHTHVGPAGSLSHYKDIVREVGAFFLERMEKLNAAGISADQVVFDPGIGFGKTPAQNLSLLAGLRNFTNSGRPLLLGVSRKSFIGKLTGVEVENRLPASLACATLAVANGVQIIRTHDVAETWQAVRMAEAILQHANVD